MLFFCYVCVCVCVSLFWPRSFRELCFCVLQPPTLHKVIFSRCSLCKIYILGTSTVYQIKQDYRRERSALHSERVKDRLLQRFAPPPSHRRRIFSLGTVWSGPRGLVQIGEVRFKVWVFFSFFTAALQFNVSPWHGIEARVDSLMASVSTDASKSFTVHLKTKEKQSFSRDADKNVFAWHVVCHIRTSDTDCFELGVIVNLSLAVGDEEQRIRSFPLRLKSKEEELEEVFLFFDQ